MRGLERIFRLFRKYHLDFVLIILVSLPNVFPLFRQGFYTMYDDMQVVRLWQMDKCIRDLQIPCRWVPDLGLGYGYPLFIYYAPLPYYLMEIIHLFGFSFITSVKLGFIFSVFASGLFFYLFLRNFLARTSAFLATFVYIYIPLRASAIYVRGAMGEAWGLANVPLVFWGLENYLKRKSFKSGILFSFTLFLFFISHNLTVLMFLPVLFLWIIARTYILQINSVHIKGIIKFFVLGFGLSSFYLIPLFLERNLVHIETLTSGYFGYLQHFLNLKQLFFSLNWGYGPSLAGVNDDAFLGIGPIHSLLVLISLILAPFFYKKNKKFFLLIILITGLFLLSSFLSHSRSTFLWKMFKLDIFQFPWRFVMVSLFCASVLSGFTFEYLPKKVAISYFVFLVLLTMILYSRYFNPKDWFYLTDTQKLSGESLKKQLTASIYDYLPKSAKKAPDDIASEDLIVIEGNLDQKFSKRGTNWFWYQVDVKTDNAWVAIPSYNFPFWKVRVDSKVKAIESYSDLGLVSFRLEKGEKNIYAKLSRNSVRVFADFVSMASFLIIFLSFYNERKFQKIDKK